MSFCGYLDTRYLREEKKRILLAPFTYITWDGEKIIVPKFEDYEFKCDGASVPKRLRWFFGDPFSDENFEPSIIHNWLCHLARQGKYSRKKADSIFSQALAEKKKFSLKRKSMWLGVRIGAILSKI